MVGGVRLNIPQLFHSLPYGLLARETSPNMWFSNADTISKSSSYLLAKEHNPAPPCSSFDSSWTRALFQTLFENEQLCFRYSLRQDAASEMSCVTSTTVLEQRQGTLAYSRWVYALCCSYKQEAGWEDRLRLTRWCLSSFMTDMRRYESNSNRIMVTFTAE